MDPAEGVISPGGRRTSAARLSRGDPLFLGEETEVVPVDSLAALAAQVMLAAARALPFLAPGAHDLLDVPPAQLFGNASPAAHDARP
jgi:hypothetical protein